MVRILRNGHHARNGLILANGGVLTYQHALCLSTRPRGNDPIYPPQDPLPTHVTDIPAPAVTATAEGEAVVEVSRFAYVYIPSTAFFLSFLYCTVLYCTVPWCSLKTYHSDLLNSERIDVHNRIRPKRNARNGLRDRSIDQ